MSTAIFSPSKTHPAGEKAPINWFGLSKAEIEMQQPTKIEIVVECQQINLVENPLKIQRTTVGTVGNHAINGNQFPSIECSAASSLDAIGTQQQQTIKVPSDLNLDRSSVTGVSGTTAAAREWKRDKTFDGCPIYCVNQSFFLLSCFELPFLQHKYVRYG